MVSSKTIVNILCLVLAAKAVRGNAIQTNHKLGVNSSVNELCGRLRNFDSSRRCNIISCIGARNWDQRYAIEKSFGLDSHLSSTISGPLKPRYDLWELQRDGDCTLLLDSDIHLGTDRKDKIAKICALSECTVLYLNADDLCLVDGSLSLNAQTKAFVKKLSRSFNIEYSRKNKLQKNIHIVLPSVESITEKFGLKKPNFDTIKAFLSKTFGEICNLYIKGHGERINFRKIYRNFAESVNPSSLCSILSSTESRDSAVEDALLDYLSNKSFYHHKNLLKDLSKDVYNGNLLEDFGNNVESSFLESLLSFYLLTYNLDGSKQKFELENIKTWFRSNTDHVYLKLISLLEEEIKSQLRQTLSKRKNADDTDKLTDQLVDEYTLKVKNILPNSVFSRWQKTILESVIKGLRQKLDNIIRVHSELPNTSLYSKEKASIKSNYQKRKRDRGLSFMLGLTAMIRERGYGNRQAFLNYNLGPLMLTLGYANDRDVAESKPGTGLMTPAFRIQPKLHLNINL